MDFYEVVKRRRSIRAYKSDPIQKKTLEKLAVALEDAPSACNLQPWSFRIVLNPEIKEKICSVYDRDWLKQAPAIIVGLGNNDEAWKRIEGTAITDIDFGIAMEHIVLAAAAEDLGTCWICAYDIKKMNSALSILPPWNVLAISPLGYPAETPDPINRKSRDEIFQIIE